MTLVIRSDMANDLKFGNKLQVHITVPEKLVASGFTQEAAEQLFLAEVARVAQVPSIVRTPEADVNSRPSVLEALVKPLHLGDVVVHARIDHGALEVDEGTLPRADLVVESDVGIQRLLTGELSPAEAIKCGAVRVTGRRKLLDRFVEVFQIPPMPVAVSA